MKVILLLAKIRGLSGNPHDLLLTLLLIEASRKWYISFRKKKGPFYDSHSHSDAYTYTALATICQSTVVHKL